MSEQHSEERKNEVRIHIDQKQYESPNPTTGAALYLLGNVAEGLVLYRKAKGNEEDELIENDEGTIRLRNGEHFHSGPARHKEITIIVNGRKKVVTQKKLTFDEIVELALDPVPTGPNITFTITYRHGPPANPEGSLMEGKTVEIKDRMIFDVTPTDKS